MDKRVKVAGASLAVASASLVAFLGLWEGTDRKVYADKLARNIPTGCYGVTNAVSPVPVVVGDVWSEAQCRDVLALVTEKKQLSLAQCFRRPPSQNTFDAFSSFAHNVGMSAACGSRAMGLFNEGRLADACRALAFRPDGTPNWSFANGVFVSGLHNRRVAEMKLCLKP
ncbi:COG3772 Phage-related lysozyme (muraminidase) [uncultured Caudovirales phage]|uniref:Endolysin n=1 Tax=uncultured Caudovirales phage TaxID=2100421 RepID=A0A6J5NMX5_9CAUD|nr:COG3772 Phage-related lysozyme (muraminidase) [uncultured Caudovirales phage]